MASGRERRRKGIYRVYRILYGVVLWMSAQAAVAADQSAGKAHLPQSPAVAANNLAMVQVHAPEGLAAFLHSELRVPVAAIPVAGQPLVAEDGFARLVALNVDSSVLGAMRDGIAVNFSMGDLGGLHLNLYKRRNAKTTGQHFEMNPGAEPSTDRHFWSLGGTLDLVKSAGGHRQILFVPQLVLDFDAVTGGHNQFQAFVSYATWQPVPGKPISDERVPQVGVKLKF